MDLIRQQSVGMNGKLELFTCLAQPSQKCAVVSIVTKRRQLIHAALNKIMRLQGNNEAGKTCHWS